ncbi:MAG: lysozyme inhibitor LprI family protein [Alphaproteobacteria bacterium]
MNLFRTFLFSISFSILIAPSSGHAQNTKTLDECFATYGQKTGELLFCVTSATNKQEEIRSIIENDYLDIIEGETFLPPPKLLEYVPPKSSKKVNEEKEIKQAKQIALKNKKKTEQYKMQKKQLASGFKKSIESFLIYREAECNRRETRYKLQKDIKMASLAKQVCLHELTKQRIKSMEASIR